MRYYMIETRYEYKEDRRRLMKKQQLGVRFESNHIDGWAKGNQNTFWYCEK